MNTEHLTAKEQKQLDRLLREKARPKGKYYIWYLLLILGLIYIIDEIISNLQSNLLNEISHSIFPDVFSGPKGIVEAAAPFVTIGGIATAIMAISMFYKPLADRFGRKPFLFINTLGMGLAIALCALARNSNTFVFYVLGFFLMRFFVTPDEQVVYIFETVPENKRATVYSIIKGIAELGLVLISVMRFTILKTDIFGNSGEFVEYQNWRYIFLICAGIAVVISFIALLFARETDPFLDTKIAYLQKTPEEREEENRKLRMHKGFKEIGFFRGLKLVLCSKQLLFLSIATLLYTAASSSISYYQTLITDAVVEAQTPWVGATAAASAATSSLNEALFIYPFTCAFITLTYGFISDRIGRKKISIVLLAITAISFSLFIVGLRLGWNFFVLGALIGLFLGSFWSAGDTYIMMASESAPTSLRVSAMTVHSLFFGLGQLISSLVVMSFIRPFQPDLYCLIATIPCFVGSLVVLILFVKETKGRKIDEIELDTSLLKDKKVEEDVVEIYENDAK